MTKADRAFYDDRRRDGAARKCGVIALSIASLYDERSARAISESAEEPQHRANGLFVRWTTLCIPANGES